MKTVRKAPARKAKPRKPQVWSGLRRKQGVSVLQLQLPGMGTTL
jgi:hypothetical protein